MSTNKEQQYNSQIKEFFNSEAYKDYLLPMIMQVAQREFPKPNEKGWEQKYIYAYALSDAFSAIMNAMHNVSGKNEFIKEMEKYLEQAIDEA